MELCISTLEEDQRPVRNGCGSPFLSIILLWIIKSPRKQDSEGFLSFLNPILLNLKMWWFCSLEFFTKRKVKTKIFIYTVWIFVCIDSRRQSTKRNYLQIYKDKEIREVSLTMWLKETKYNDGIVRLLSLFFFFSMSRIFEILILLSHSECELSAGQIKVRICLFS